MLRFIRQINSLQIVVAGYNFQIFDDDFCKNFQRTKTNNKKIILKLLFVHMEQNKILYLGNKVQSISSLTMSNKTSVSFVSD